MKAAVPTFHAVVSDLHFGDGGPLEDFVYDHDFELFLDHIAAEGASRGGVAELVINGDFIDFLQVEPLRHGPWRDALGKVDRVARAHRATFDALGRFARAGNRVVVLPGNHDIELSFGDVQAALRGQLAGGDAEVAGRIVFPNDNALRPHFKGWKNGPFVHRLPGVYIEHGNQFDELNFFDHAEFFAGRGEDRIHLPWGSHFVLDLFNEVEEKYPFIDKLRPRSAAILILWLLDPKLVRERLPALAALGPRLYPELRRFHRQVRTVAGEGAKGAEAEAASGPEERFLGWLGDQADALETLDKYSALLDPTEEAGSKGAWGVPEKVSAAYASVFRAALDALTSRPDRAQDDDGYAEHAFALAGSEDAEVVVLGHTHGIKDIAADGRRYLNSGTWIGLLDVDHAALRSADAAEYRALLGRLRAREAFKPAKLLTFVSVAYPNGRLDARICVFRDGVAHQAITP